MTKTSPATAKLASGSERECESMCPGVLNGSFQVTSISLLIAGELLSNCNKTEVRSLPHNIVPAMYLCDSHIHCGDVIVMRCWNVARTF